MWQKEEGGGKNVMISNNIDIFDKMPNYIRSTTFL